MNIKLVTIFAFLQIYDVLASSCVPRYYGYSSIVCVCNETHCDEIPPLDKPSNDGYFVYTSTESGLRMHKQEYQFEEFEANDTHITVTVDTSQRYQTVMGWGGSFTDATGINFNSLDKITAGRLLSSYFSANGLQYNMGRVPIGGTDFSTRGYSYDDGDEDLDLLHFNLTSDDFHYKIPLIKFARELSKGKLKLFASAWTAPNWMKNNGKYTGPDSLKFEMYQTWANYFLKFLSAYALHGIQFWGLTTGNEPSTGLSNSQINSVGWFPKLMGNFIAENLGPTIRNSEFASLKLIAIDDQINNFPREIEAIFDNEKAKSYIDGFGLHYYLNTWYPKEWLTETHGKYPDKFILATEACEGYSMGEPHVKLGDWGRAENYAADIISDMNNWVTGWIDWNMALDLTGGPTYINNYVDSPIIVNSTGGEFYKQPTYYALAHFTKFIPQGSHRIAFTQSSDNVAVSAFIRPDDAVVVTILNRLRAVRSTKSLYYVFYWFSHLFIMPFLSYITCALQFFLRDHYFGMKFSIFRILIFTETLLDL
ncbi:hypothetical protein RI129_007354 [Pyrocoelia pectoralis]|uniref:Glucosylceramidase n=1 Tax=Pyrocoelia pectoralis TaxID=417401 RepID=A0AAN7VC76_9COLE